jgi:hypothetical protein
MPSPSDDRRHQAVPAFHGAKTQHVVIEEDIAMSPLVTALLAFGALVLIGLIAKIAIGIWMKRQ